MIDDTSTANEDRKPWVKPEVALIQAASAELGGGATSDGLSTS